MKQFQLIQPSLLLLCLFFFYSCQQQVSEITYDLDAQSISNQTRDSQRKIILQEAVDYTEEQSIKVFRGSVSDINASDTETIIIKVINDKNEVLDFKIDFLTSEKITSDMKLVVRYLEKEEGPRLVEIKRED